MGAVQRPAVRRAAGSLAAPPAAGHGGLGAPVACSAAAALGWAGPPSVARRAPPQAVGAGRGLAPRLSSAAGRNRRRAPAVGGGWGRAGLGAFSRRPAPCYRWRASFALRRSRTRGTGLAPLMGWRPRRAVRRLRALREPRRHLARPAFALGTVGAHGARSGTRPAGGSWVRSLAPASASSARHLYHGRLHRTGPRPWRPGSAALVAARRRRSGRLFRDVGAWQLSLVRARRRR